MKTKVKKWKYNTSCSFTYNTKEHGGIKQSFMTQLYQIGVYIIWNGNSAEQGSMSPDQMVTLMKRIKKLEVSGEITDLVLGREITVTDETGFFVEVD